MCEGFEGHYVFEPSPLYPKKTTHLFCYSFWCPEVSPPPSYLIDFFPKFFFIWKNFISAKTEKILFEKMPRNLAKMDNNAHFWPILCSFSNFCLFLFFFGDKELFFKNDEKNPAKMGNKAHFWQILSSFFSLLLIFNYLLLFFLTGSPPPLVTCPFPTLTQLKPVHMYVESLSIPARLQYWVWETRCCC